VPTYQVEKTYRQSLALSVVGSLRSFLLWQKLFCQYLWAKTMATFCKCPYC